MWGCWSWCWNFVCSNTRSIERTDGNVHLFITELPNDHPCPIPRHLLVNDVTLALTLVELLSISLIRMDRLVSCLLLRSGTVFSPCYGSGSSGAWPHRPFEHRGFLCGIASMNAILFIQSFNFVHSKWRTIDALNVWLLFSEVLCFVITLTFCANGSCQCTPCSNHRTVILEPCRKAEFRKPV